MSDDLKKLTEQLRNIVSTYERKNPLRTADFHGEDCACYRCAIDACDAAVNALPELLAVKAERDRAQRACEQMGARITEMENSLREIGAAIINGATDTLWMGDQISDETVVDFICNLTGDDPSLLGTFARAALKETGQ